MIRSLTPPARARSGGSAGGRGRRLARLTALFSGLSLVAGLGLVADPPAANAAGAPFQPIAASDVARLHLTKVDDRHTIAGQLAGAPGMQQAHVPDLAGIGHEGGAGLCYPTPINPGVDPIGYCWKDHDDEFGNQNARWAPQGLSLPHSLTSPDGIYAGGSWQVVSWHNSTADYKDGGLARVTFVDTSEPTPHYSNVLLVKPTAADQFAADPIHADSVVWFGDHLLVGTGQALQVFDLANLARVNTLSDAVGIQGSTASAAQSNYVLPYSYVYSTLGGADSTCSVVTGVSPCINGMSYDAADQALVSSEYLKNAAGARIIRWPFDTATGLPRTDSTGVATAGAAWSSPVWDMQGVVMAHGDIYTTGLCPDGYHNGNRYNSCIHTGAPGSSPHVLTTAPDGSQNLDYDAVGGRIWGVNEMITATTIPLRVVFGILAVPKATATVRFKNVGSGKCLMPYHFSIDPGAYVVQSTCDGENAQNWYWVGNTIRSYSSRECLTVEGAFSTDNAHATIWDCNGSDAQDWTLAPGAGGNMIVNGHSGKCLTIYGASPTDDAEAVQWTCDTTQSAHAWTGSS